MEESYRAANAESLVLWHINRSGRRPSLTGSVPAMWKTRPCARSSLWPVCSYRTRRSRTPSGIRASQSASGERGRQVQTCAAMTSPLSRCRQRVMSLGKRTVTFDGWWKPQAAAGRSILPVCVAQASQRLSRRLNRIGSSCRTRAVNFRSVPNSKNSRLTTGAQASRTAGNAA